MRLFRLFQILSLKKRLLINNSLINFIERTTITSDLSESIISIVNSGLFTPDLIRDAIKELKLSLSLYQNIFNSYSSLNRGKVDGTIEKWIYSKYANTINKISNFLKLAIKALMPYGLLWLYRKHVEQKIAKIKFPAKKRVVKKTMRNYRNKLKELRNAKRPINIFFLVWEREKWNGDILYNLLSENQLFEPKVVQVVLSKDLKGKDLENYEFFSSKNYNHVIVTGEKELIKMKPDILFYQQPWFVLDGYFMPEKMSEYALNLYFPYSIATSIEDNYIFTKSENFFKSIYMQFVFDDDAANQYKIRGIKNVLVTGHPKLDAYSKSIDEDNSLWKSSKEMYRIIYAPHHSFKSHSLGWATFEWNGVELLNYAKQHSDITEWVFKPHPKFKFEASRIMNLADVNSYYNDWESIGQVYDSGDYFDMFRTADLLITDCGSFLTEWLPTEKPCIHLLSNGGDVTNRSIVHENSSKNYYNVTNIEELNKKLDMLILRNEDPLKEARINDAREIKLCGSQNIYNWLIENLKIGRTS